MNLYYLAALLGVAYAASILVPGGAARVATLRARVVASPGATALARALRGLRETAARTSLPLIVAALAATLLAEIAVVRAMIAHVPSFAALERSVPVAFLPWSGYASVFAAPGLGALRSAFALILVVRAAALWALWVRARDRAPGRFDAATIVSGALVMYGAALTARGMVSADLYGYLAYARLGVASYAPPAHLFPGTPFAPLEAVADTAWANLNPAPYGPLWLALSGLVAGRAPSLWSAALLERGLGLLAMAALTWAVARTTRRREAALLVALNPSLIYAFVVEAHNDAVPLALIAAGFVAVGRRPALTFAAVVCAGLIKAPYGVVGLLAFANVASPAARVALAAGSVVATVAISGLWGGHAYLHGLLYHADHNGRADRLAATLAHAALALGALVAVALAVLRRRVSAGFAFAPPSLAAAAYPWYLAMGLPYALLEGGVLAPYLILLPIASLAMQPLLSGKALGLALVVLTLVCLAVGELTSPSARPAADPVETPA